MESAPGTLGEQLGPYELLNKISVGGMAETFLARRRGPGGFEQTVCIKRVLPAFAEDPEFTRLFLDEAKLAAQLRHPNIVQVYDFGQHEDAYYLALELIEGMDLRYLLRILNDRGRTMAPKLVAIIGTEVASALEYAHHLQIGGQAAGIVHRDISPSNVLLSYTGAVKLADFGIAKATTHAHVTRSGVVKGKVPYMAPEHATGTDIDARSDLFSLGVLMYEALSGFRPYDGPNDVATLTNLINGNYKPLAEVAPETPKHFAQVIERLLNADPDKRYQSAAELLDALMVAAPPSTTRRALGSLIKEARSAQPTPVELAKTSTSSGVIERPSESVPSSEHSEASLPPSGSQAPTSQGGRAASAPNSAEMDTRTHSASSDIPALDMPSDSAGNSSQARASGSHDAGQAAFAPTVASGPSQSAASSEFMQPASSLHTQRVLAFAANHKKPLAVLVAALMLASLTFMRWQSRHTGTEQAQAESETSEVLLADMQAAPSPEEASQTATAQEQSTKENTALVDQQDSPEQAQPAGVTDEDPAETEQLAEVQEPDTSNEQIEEAEATRSAATAAVRKGSISAQVTPWGNIWINGKLAGKSPITQSLDPGTYRIGGGHNRPVVFKNVTVKRGRTAQVRIHITREQMLQSQ